MKQRYGQLCLSLCMLLSACNRQVPISDAIHPDFSKPSFWSYKGERVLLLGGSVEDNLFQVADLEYQLDLLASHGGNYVRNTMSSRDSGNVWAFDINEEDLYDLNKWNDVYWSAFERLLKLTAEREIIVQIEIWATFDFYRENWDVNPFNPVNNINYDSQRSKLPVSVDTHPIYTENNFFRSIPSQMALAAILGYQAKFVDKLLSYSLRYDNILYCIDNETSVSSDWGYYWAEYVQKKAFESGKRVYITEMWDPWDLSHPFHNETFDNPEIFGFVDISQNNHITGEDHWINGLKQLNRLKVINAVRPANNVKVYGNDGGRHKSTRNGIESFIQNAFMGCASTRFHRPASGQGLNEMAQHVISSIRSLSDQMDWFEAIPDNTCLSGREQHEAYCRRVDGNEYAVYFPDGGEVILDLSAHRGNLNMIWLDVLGSEWQGETQVSNREQLVLKAPGEGHWICLVR